MELVAFDTVLWCNEERGLSFMFKPELRSSERRKNKPNTRGFINPRAKRLTG
jgi:hypothetical protein